MLDRLTVIDVVPLAGASRTLVRDRGTHDNGGDRNQDDCPRHRDLRGGGLTVWA
jgi:hypothetical protein